MLNKFTEKKLRRRFVDPNEMVQYLTSEQTQFPALYSLQILDSNKNLLNSNSIVEIIRLINNPSNPSDVRLNATKILLGYYPNSDQVLSFFNSHYVWLTIQGADDEVLSTVGKLCENNREKCSSMLRLARPIFSSKLAYARQEFPSLVGQPFSSNFLFAIDFQIYEEDIQVSKLCSVILINLVNNPPNTFSASDISKTINLLLFKFNSDSSDVEQKLFSICCGDTNLASVVLWELNQVKDKSVIAQKTLKIFSDECNKNKYILEAIETRKYKKEDAFDKAIEKYRLSRLPH